MSRYARVPLGSGLKLPVANAPSWDSLQYYRPYLASNRHLGLKAVRQRRTTSEATGRLGFPVYWLRIGLPRASHADPQFLSFSLILHKN